jgi:hypothetical protein
MIYYNIEADVQRREIAMTYDQKASALGERGTKTHENSGSK